MSAASAVRTSWCAQATSTPPSRSTPTAGATATSPSRDRATSAWAQVETANHSHRQTSPEPALYTSTVGRCGLGRARLTVARKIARRAYHVLSAEAA